MLLIETKKKGQGWTAAIAAVFLSIFPSLSHAAIAATQELTPSTVPFGGLTRWSLDIQSPSTNSRGVSFDAALPAGVVVADVPRGTSNCPSGTVSAVAGSSSISLAGLDLGANESCAIELDLAVTSGATINAFTISSDDGSATICNHGTQEEICPKWRFSHRSPPEAQRYSHMQSSRAHSKP